MPVIQDVSRAARPTVSVGVQPSGGIKAPVKLRVEVDDHRLSQQIPGFDGLERLFALVPTETQNPQAPVVWKRYELSYVATTFGGHDHHWGDAEAIPETVQKYGIAFGMETNRGTYWLQHPGQNFR
jgi:hypothetical protein